MSKRQIYRLMAVGLAFILLGLAEVSLRVFGVAPGEEYNPPRLVKVVKDGQVQGEFIQSTQPVFQQSQNTLQTNPLYHRGAGDGFPVDGSMRKSRFSLSPSVGTQRWFLLGGSAALGQNPVNLKQRPRWSVEKLGNNVSALPLSLSISGHLESL